MLNQLVDHRLNLNYLQAFDLVNLSPNQKYAVFQSFYHYIKRMYNFNRTLFIQY